MTAPEPPAVTPGQEAELTPYGIAMEALEQILELDTGSASFDDARAIASHAHSRAIGHWQRPAQPAPEQAPDVRPREDGRRGLDITCGKCGEDYGTNVTDLDQIECVTCEARRCPHCLTWYGGNA